MHFTAPCFMSLNRTTRKGGLPRHELIFNLLHGPLVSVESPMEFWSILVDDDDSDVLYDAILVTWTLIL